MAYVIEKFGAAYASATELPTLEGRQPQGSSPVASSLITLPGGASFDWRGDWPAAIPSQEIVLEGEWVAASVAAMETKLAALKELAGTRSKLWRSNGTAQHWRTARLLEVDSDLSAGLAATARFRMRFALASGPWYGETERAVSAVLDTAQKSLACPHLGNARVTNPRIEVWAGAEAITGLVIDVYGVAQMLWNGTLGVGQTLTIDCGLRSVKIGSTDAYRGFGLHAVWHKISDWLRIEPGGTTVVFTRTGGGSNAAAIIRYNDGWV